MKKQFILGLSLLSFGLLQAQEKEQYLHFSIGGGLHNLSYKLQDGTQKGKFGYTFNAAYSYFFTTNWGVQSGLGLQSFNSLSTLNHLNVLPSIDYDGTPYEFRSNFKSWEEKQQSLFLEIPLLAQYRYAFSPKFKLLASAGPKISIPVSAKYKTTGGELVTTRYYSRWNAELSDMPLHGLTTIKNSTYEGDLSLKPAYTAVVNLGGLYKINEKLDLYLGGYFNYGLNNILKQESKSIYQADGNYNGFFASNQVTKVTPISVGVTVGVYLKLGKKPIKPEIEQLPVINHRDTVVIYVEKKVPVEVAPKQEDKVAEQPKQVEQPKAEDPIMTAIKIAESLTVYFDYNSVDAGTTYDEKIKPLSQILIANPDIKIHLVGHTCNIGTYNYNLKKGLKRVKSIKMKFYNQGVPPSQVTLESKSYGEPVVPNTSDENRAKNRRVEVKVFRK